jgi:hypothetical protein
VFESVLKKVGKDSMRNAGIYRREKTREVGQFDQQCNSVDQGVPLQMSIYLMYHA